MNKALRYLLICMMVIQTILPNLTFAVDGESGSSDSTEVVLESSTDLPTEFVQESTQNEPTEQQDLSNNGIADALGLNKSDDNEDDSAKSDDTDQSDAAAKSDDESTPPSPQSLVMPPVQMMMLVASSATVTTEAEFFAALADPAITEINLGGDIALTTKAFIMKDDLIINGNGHTISLPTKTGWGGTPDQRGELANKGDYIFQVFQSSNVSIKNLTLEGGDAAMLLTNSTVTLSTIAILNPDVGGIEVKGSSIVTIAGAITEIGNPGAIFWIDGPTNNGMIVGAAGYDLVEKVINNQFTYISLADFLANNQEYSLATGSMCTLNTDKKSVFPSLIASTGDYGYYMTITDKKTNTASNYIYYGGAINTPIDTCAESATVNLPIIGNTTITNGQIIPINLIFANVNLTVTKTGSEPTCSYSIAGTSSAFNEYTKIVFYYQQTGPQSCSLIGGTWQRTSGNKDSNYKGTCSFNIDATAALNSANSYSPNTFDVNTLTLPNITPQNKSGYAVEYFPLVLDNTAVAAIEVLNLSENTWVSVDNNIKLALENPLYTTLGASAGTCGIGIELPTVTAGGGSCNLSTIGTTLSTITALLGSNLLGGFGQTLTSLGSIGLNLGGLLGGLQGGNVDPDTLTDLQDSLAGIKLPDFTATAASLNALADSLEQANPCLSFLGTDATATIAALRSTATAMNDLDTNITGIESAINTLQSSHLTASQYLDALSDLTDSLANTFVSLASLQTSLDGLADSMDSLSIPGVGNLGVVAPVFSVVADLLDGIVNTTSGLVGGLHQVSDTLDKVADLVRAIETKDTDALIDALDALAQTNAFNQAQQTTIATLAAAQDVINTVKAIYAIPVPVLDTNNLSCDTVEAHQGAMIAYLDAQITLYTTLQTNVTALDAVVNVGATDINAQIAQIIAQLNSIKSQVSSINVQTTCANGGAALAALKLQLDNAKADLADAIADAHTMLNNLKDQITAHVSSIQATLETINNTIDAVINMIPGISSAVKAQIKTILENLQVKLIAELGNFVQSSQAYLLKQKLDAPTFGDLTCEEYNEIVSTDSSVTFTMNTHAKANEVWGYVATVTAPDLTTSVYVLPGSEASDLVIDTDDTGSYTMTVRTIGKDAFVHTQPVFDFLATLDLTNTQFAHIGDFSQLQASLNLFNASIGTWTKLTNAGVLKSDDVISTLNSIDALVAQYSGDTSRRGQAVQALFNPTATYTAIVTTQPSAADVYVYAITDEEVSVSLSGSDVDGADLSYILNGEESSANFDATYATSQTISYSVSKTVGSCDTSLTAEADLHVFVIDRPTTMDVTITGEVNTAFSVALTGSNITGSAIYTISGTIGTISGNIFAGMFPVLTGTSTTLYEVCITINGYLAPVCSNTSSISIVATPKLVVDAGTGSTQTGNTNTGSTNTGSTVNTGSTSTGSNSGGSSGGGDSGSSSSSSSSSSSNNGGFGGFSEPTPVKAKPSKEIVLGGEVDQLLTSSICSTQGSMYPSEENDAYMYACDNDITTMRTIQKARMNDYITRAELAKMISQYAVKELGLVPNTDKDCSAFEESNVLQTKEMKDFMIIACQLDIMGIKPNKLPLEDFRPNDTVTRAEFGTVMSRMMWGNKYESSNPEMWYVDHL